MSNTYIDTSSRFINVSPSSLEDLEGKIKLFLSEGYWIRVHKFRSKGTTYYYLKARKTENGKRKEVTIGRVSEEELKVLKEKGFIKGRQGGTSNTTTSGRSKTGSKRKNSSDGEQARGGVGGHDQAMSCQDNGLRGVMVHRLGLKFTKPWVSPLYLSSIGKVKYVEKSKQYIVKVEVGKKRTLTVQVNRDGTAQVFLEASDNPLSVEEFVGFCKFYLLELFTRITGKEVSLSDFEVMTAPELNVDMDGVVIEGVRAVTLEDYYDELVRIYYSDPGVKETMPNGGTRVEVRASSWGNRPLRDVVDGLTAFSKLPTLLSDIQTTLEEIKGSMSFKQIEISAITEAIATKMANLLWAMFEKHDGRLVQVIKEAFKEFADRVEEYIRNNGGSVDGSSSSGGSVGGSSEGNGVLTWDRLCETLPRDLCSLLVEMDREGYIRIMHDRIAYGDKTWQAIRYFKGNIDAWLEDQSYMFLDPKNDMRGMFMAVMKAIRFYDNKYNGETGVPWREFLRAFDMFYRS